MITTITTTTVTTVTTIAALGLIGSISIAAIVTLIFFLTTKELASSISSGTSSRKAKFVSVGILPLAMAFVTIVAVKVAELLA